MKRIILILLSANILTVNSTQLLSCSEVIDQKTKKNKHENENKNDNHKNDNHKNDNHKNDNHKNDNHKNDNHKNDNHKNDNHKNDNHKNDNNDASKDEQSNFILDLNSNYNPITTSRGWNGTLYDQSKIDKFLSNNNSDYTSFTNEQTNFIKKFTFALHSSASKEASKKFDDFLKQKSFLNINDLVNTINTHNKNSSTNSYIDVPLELIQNHAANRVAFEEILLKVYNTLASFFGKDYSYKIVRTLAISRKKPGETTDVLGETMYQQGGRYNAISMHINEGILKPNNSEAEYQMGWITTPHIYETFVHEFGHAIEFFHRSHYPFHENIDAYSGLENKYSTESIAHNEYKKEYCQNLTFSKKTCPYKFNPNYLTAKPISNFNSSNKASYAAFNNNDYSFNQTDALIKFILSKVKHLKIPGNTFAEQDYFIKNMLLRIFINSDYGRSDLAEVHSEGFAYWLLTPENERDKAWEIWNKFFLDYLPKLRSEIPHFNDYLNIQNYN